MEDIGLDSSDGSQGQLEASWERGNYFRIPQNVGN